MSNKKLKKNVINLTSKKKNKKEIKHEKEDLNDIMFSELERLTYPNNKEYLLIMDDNHYALIAKKVRVNINTTNNNNVFMPYEKSFDKDICMMAIIRWEKKSNSFIEYLKSIGCPIYDINNPESINEVLKKIGNEQ